jgi:hypothetical protein
MPTKSHIVTTSEERIERINTLQGAYDLMAQRYKEIKDYTHFNPSFAAVTIEDYLQARKMMIKRDKIRGNPQWHKIAGLMASSIVLNKPIQLVPDNADSKWCRLSRDNEFLAVLHGLAICAEGKSKRKIESVVKLPHFRKWFDDFVYLLHKEPSNRDGFILTFETLSLTYFSGNLDNTK